MLFPKVASDIAQHSTVTPSKPDDCLNGQSPTEKVMSWLAILRMRFWRTNLRAFGAREFDVTSALKAMVRGADTPDLKFDTHPERPDLRSYLERGYVYYEGDDSHDEEGTAEQWLRLGHARISERGFYDCANGQGAGGDTVDADKFLSRSADWRKSFDPDTRYIRARDKEGNFRPGIRSRSRPRLRGRKFGAIYLDDSL